MIFGVKNEEGESTFDLVLNGDKIVTRRLLGGRLYDVGKDYAVQPGRGKKSVARIKIISNMSHGDWWNKYIVPLNESEAMVELRKEAKREGFRTWKGLANYFAKSKIPPSELIRYEFVLINQKNLEL